MVSKGHHSSLLIESQESVSDYPSRYQMSRKKLEFDSQNHRPNSVKIWRLEVEQEEDESSEEVFTFVTSKHHMKPTLPPALPSITTRTPSRPDPIFPFSRPSTTKYPESKRPYLPISTTSASKPSSSPSTTPTSKMSPNSNPSSTQTPKPSPGIPEPQKQNGNSYEDEYDESDYDNDQNIASSPPMPTIEPDYSHNYRPSITKPDYPLPVLPPLGPPKQAAWNYITHHSVRSADDVNAIATVGGEKVTTMWNISPHGGFVMTEELAPPGGFEDNPQFSHRSKTRPKKDKKFVQKSLVFKMHRTPLATTETFPTRKYDYDYIDRDRKRRPRSTTTMRPYFRERNWRRSTTTSAPSVSEMATGQSDYFVPWGILGLQPREA